MLNPFHNFKYLTSFFATQLEEPPFKSTYEKMRPTQIISLWPQNVTIPEKGDLITFTGLTHSQRAGRRQITKQRPWGSFLEACRPQLLTLTTTSFCFFSCLVICIRHCVFKDCRVCLFLYSADKVWDCHLKRMRAVLQH